MCKLLELNDEIWSLILVNIDILEIVNIQLICKRFRNIVNDALFANKYRWYKLWIDLKNVTCFEKNILIETFYKNEYEYDKYTAKYAIYGACETDNIGLVKKLFNFLDEYDDDIYLSYIYNRAFKRSMRSNNLDIFDYCKNKSNIFDGRFKIEELRESVKCGNINIFNKCVDSYDEIVNDGHLYEYDNINTEYLFGTAICGKNNEIIKFFEDKINFTQLYEHDIYRIMYFSCMTNNKRLINKCIENSFDDWNYALKAALSGKQMDLFNELKNKVNKLDYDELLIEANNILNYDLVKEYLDNGADPNKIISNIINNNQYYMFKLIMKYHKPDPKLISELCRQNRHKMLKLFEIKYIG